MPRNTILLRGRAREEAGIADAAITPGALIDITGDGTYNNHAVAGGVGVPIFARAQHENQGAGIDDAIALGDEVTALYPELGAKINALTADTIVAGQYVESAGDGTVRLYGSGFRIGQAAKDADLTAGRVEIVVAPLGV